MCDVLDCKQLLHSCNMQKMSLKGTVSQDFRHNKNFNWTCEFFYFREDIREKTCVHTVHVVLDYEETCWSSRRLHKHRVRVVIDNADTR